MLIPKLLITYNVTNELEHIIQGCIDGDRSQQEKLYQMFASKMYGVCLRYSKNPEQAKDILQDGFVKVFEKIGQFRSEGSFEGWLRRLMINTALERFRKQRQVVSLDLLPDVAEMEDTEDDEVAFSMDELLSYIQMLPERYRMVFNLYVMEEMTHKEVAEMMGITEGTSKSDLSRARVILQNLINKKLNQVAKAI
jgi:RNA polymerase sigma factor, sigma-70 family